MMSKNARQIPEAARHALPDTTTQASARLSVTNTMLLPTGARLSAPRAAADSRKNNIPDTWRPGYPAPSAMPMPCGGRGDQNPQPVRERFAERMPFLGRRE